MELALMLGEASLRTHLVISKKGLFFGSLEARMTVLDSIESMNVGAQMPAPFRLLTVRSVKTDWSARVSDQEPHSSTSNGSSDQVDSPHASCRSDFVSPSWSLQLNPVKMRHWQCHALGVNRTCFSQPTLKKCHNHSKMNSRRTDLHSHPCSHSIRGLRFRVALPKVEGWVILQNSSRSVSRTARRRHIPSTRGRRNQTPISMSTCGQVPRQNVVVFP